MKTIITVRHCEIPDDLKRRADELLSKVAKMAHRPQRAEVVFDADGGRKVVEIQLHLPQNHVKVASAEDTDFRSALDAAIAKLRSQVGKNDRRGGRRPATG